MEVFGPHFQPHRVCYESIFGFKPQFTVRKRSSSFTTDSSQHNVAVIVHHSVVIVTASCNNDIIVPSCPTITLHLNAASLLAPTNVHHKDSCSMNKMHIAASLSYFPVQLRTLNTSAAYILQSQFTISRLQSVGLSNKNVLRLFVKAFVDTSSQRISSKHIFANEKARS